MLSYGVKILKIAHGLYFDYDTKLAAMATYIEESEKLDRIVNIHTNISHLVKKIVKISAVDPEIALLNLKRQ